MFQYHHVQVPDSTAKSRSDVVLQRGAIDGLGRREKAMEVFSQIELASADSKKVA